MNVDGGQAHVGETAACIYEEPDILIGAAGALVAEIARGLLDLHDGFEYFAVRVVSDTGQLFVGGIVRQGKYRLKLGSRKIAKIVWICGNELGELVPFRVSLGKLGGRFVDFSHVSPFVVLRCVPARADRSDDRAAGGPVPPCTVYRGARPIGTLWSVWQRSAVSSSFQAPQDWIF